jgi:hypothetical protein
MRASKQPFWVRGPPSRAVPQRPLRIDLAFYGAAEGQKPPPSGSGQAVLDPSDRSLKFSNRKEGIRQKPSRGGGMAEKELCSVCEEYLAEWYCKKCDRKICQVPFLLPLATQTLEKIFLSSWKITSFSTRRAPTSKGHEAIIRSSACLFPQYCLPRPSPHF